MLQIQKGTYANNDGSKLSSKGNIMMPELRYKEE